MHGPTCSQTYLNPEMRPSLTFLPFDAVYLLCAKYLVVVSAGCSFVLAAGSTGTSLRALRVENHRPILT